MPTFVLTRSVRRTLGVACVLAAIARIASAQAPPAAAPAPVPVFNRVNQSLPAWLRVRGEFRERMEGFNNFAFTDGRDTNFFLSRVRLQAMSHRHGTLPAVHGSGCSSLRRFMRPCSIPLPASTTRRRPRTSSRLPPRITGTSVRN